MRMSPEDRAAFADARIAAVKAGPEADARSGEAVAAGRGRGAGFRQDADRSRQCADECAEDDERCAEAGRSGGAPARTRRQDGDHGGGDEAYRGCGRPALQDPRRRPEAPPQGPHPFRPRRLAAPATMSRATGIATATGWAATGIMATTAMAGRAGITAAGVPGGSSRRGIRSIEVQEKPPDSGGFSDSARSPPMAGNNPSACWTSRDRFAKRRPLEKAFPGRFRAHSSVGRADDS